MKHPKSGARKAELFATAAAATALTWGALGLLWAQVIVLPEPLLPPPSFAELLGRIPATPRPDRFVVMLFKETSLLLTAYASLGLLACVLAGRAGARKSSLLVGATCAAVLAVSLVPVAQAAKTSSAEGVPLSLGMYFADLSPVPKRFEDRSPETVTYARSGGELLKADVWEPPDDAKGPGRRSGQDVTAKGRPAVIVVHGGGWRSGERSEFPSWDAWLAEEGYVVFDIDYSLSPPPTWQTAPADVVCAVGWVKENATRYKVDPERVALMGRSAGGQLALLTAYEGGVLPPRRAAPRTASGTPGWPRWRRSTHPPTSCASPPWDTCPAWTVSWGAHRTSYRDATVTSRPSPASTPATRPPSSPTAATTGIVPPSQSELLGEQLDEASVPHRLVELPWANHTFDFLWGGWGAQITRPALKGFLEEHL